MSSVRLLRAQDVALQGDRHQLARVSPSRQSGAAKRQNGTAKRQNGIAK